MNLSALCKSPISRDLPLPESGSVLTKTLPGWNLVQYCSQRKSEANEFHRGRPIFLAMKLISVLLFAACLQVSANSYTQTVTIHMENAPLENVLKEIKKQTDYNFFYESGLLQNAKLVNVSVNKFSIEQTLAICFQQQPFEYRVVENTVFIKRKEPAKPEQNEIIQQNPGDLKGHIENSKGEPLAGTNITVKRTGKGTIADANGNFVLLDLNNDDVIIISYVGYQSQSIKVGDRGTISLTLGETNNELDQVIMQAYGTTTRRLATGNIAKVTSEEISKQPVINPLQALQGRVPGLTVTQTSGYGSAPFKVEIRGRNNINDVFTSDPLYVIDGVPLTISDLAGSSYSLGSAGFLQNGMASPTNGQSPLFNINPLDIESIEVLKDADATAIYGSRAANGAILITTKKGRIGKTKLTGNFSQGVSTVTRNWDMLSSTQYIEMRREALRNDNITATPSNAYDLLTWDTTKYTDWQNFVWGKTGKLTDAQLGLSGGNNQASYRLSGGYNYRTDITAFNGADERVSLSSNFSFKSLNQKLTVSLTSMYTFTNSDMVYMPAFNAATLAPDAPDAFDINGKPNYTGWKPANYPFTNLFQPYSSKTNFLNSNLVINYRLLKSFDLRTSLGYNNAHVKQTQLTPISSLDPTTSPTGSAVFGTNDNNNIIIEPQLEYNSRIYKGKLNALIGSTFQSTSTEGTMTIGTGYTSDLLLNTISNAVSKNANESFGQYKYAALFARINYNLENKYIINVSARRDGSSRFGESKQFGNFSAIGAAWVFSEEKVFKKNIHFLSFGKIRGSYGTTGNDAVGDYKYLTRWSSSGTVPYAGNSALLPLQHSNNQFHWPTNRKLEAAMDLGLLDDKISFSFAWYRNRCNDQLVSFPLAIYTGFSNVVANSPALVQNMGWEFTMTGKIISEKKLNWNVTFNTGINRNKLLSYPNLKQSPYYGQYVVGQPLNIVKRLHYTGVDTQTGYYTFEDRQKDGLINMTNDSTDDRYIIKSDPRFSGGFGMNLNYKGLYLSMFFFAVKQKGINSLKFVGKNMPGTINNTSLYVFNHHWQNPGEIAEFAKFSTTNDISFSNFGNSDGVYTDASYIRFSNISISYSLPDKLIRKSGFQSVQFTLNAQNVFTISKYKGIDPETQNFGGLPPAKIITGSLNFTL
jgi:TonB-linked SusC/RagA family outer membrane protein